MTEIYNGAGDGGYGAKVDSQNRLWVKGVASPEISIESLLGNSPGITTPQRTVTATGGPLLYIKNTSADKIYRMSTIWFNWNGGNSNHDRAAFGTMYVGISAPSANHTQGGAGSLYTGYAGSYDLDVYYWDEVSNGMTISDADAQHAAFYFMISQGSTPYKLDGAVILAPNTAMAFALQGDGEAGEGSINVIGTMVDA